VTGSGHQNLTLLTCINWSHRVDVRRSLRTPWRWGALALLAVPVLAQSSDLTAASDWRNANDAVGEFKRGHIDLLKWERAHLPAEKSTPANAPGLQLPTAQDAVRLAWRAHPDLADAQSRMGADNLALVASGRWTEVDISLQRRVDDMGELLEVAAGARKAWVAAVAAAQVVRYRQTAMDSTDAALELGRRMVSVGNWSAMQGRPVELAHLTARMDLRRAEVAAAQSQGELMLALGMMGAHDRVGLPEALSGVPTETLGAQALDERVAALKAQLPLAAARRLPANAGQAMAVYRASHALASDSAEVVKLRGLVAEEVGLQYNGMLASVWDLLDAMRNLAQARVDAALTQRDFWQAETDLQWVLQGGSPRRLVSLGSGGGDAPAAAGH
jgi:hypothetical protein